MRYAVEAPWRGLGIIGRAVAEACGTAALYLGVIGGLMWQVAEAAGYLV